MKRLIPASLVLMLAILACSIPTFPTEPPVVTELPDGEPVVTEPPLPTEPHLPTVSAPIGFVVLPGTSSADFYTSDGGWMGGVLMGDTGFYGVSNLHVAGSASTGTAPLVYFSWRDDPMIIENVGGTETTLMLQPDFNRLSGAEGSEWFAYTTATYADTGLHTQLYVGTPATISSAVPVVDEMVPDGYGLKPLAFRMEGGVPTGIWTTGCMYGIGGDLVFDPCNRLNFIDLITGVRTELVGDGFMPSKLSPDHNWVAYARPGGGEPLTILNLATGANFTFPIWAQNDRGSGNGVFSPDNQYVAWMEGSGYRMDTPYTFKSMVRIATTSGVMVGDFPVDLFGATAGFPVTWASPVGWLDNDSVLIQVGDMDWVNFGLMRLDMPGTLVWLTNGNFAGFTYP